MTLRNPRIGDTFKVEDFAKIFKERVKDVTHGKVELPDEVALKIMNRVDALDGKRDGYLSVQSQDNASLYDEIDVIIDQECKGLKLWQNVDEFYRGQATAVAYGSLTENPLGVFVENVGTVTDALKNGLAEYLGL